MDARLFAAGYQPTLPPERIHRGSELFDITEAQDWSYNFGRLLHARLNDAEPDTLPDTAAFHVYRRWGNGFHDLEDRALSDPVNGIRVRNELNFHAMNRLMLGMWEPVANGYWTSEKSRLGWISQSQDMLAYEGVHHYIAREHFIRDAGSHALFEAGADETRRVMNGVSQEFDAAIILLDFMRRHRDITVVPAPLQFERSNNPRRNVDFIVHNFKEKRAVGVQVRTSVKQEDFANADPDRVVFVDGIVDLGNVRAVRTQKGRSHERVVPWAGIIAAKRMDTIKTHGKNTVPQFIRSSQHILQIKMEARRLVGSLTVDYRDISLRIGERIMNKL